MRLFTTFLASLIAVQLLCGVSRADRIKLKSGGFYPPGKPVTVIEETYEHIKFKDGDTEGSIGQAKVAEIQWSNVPTYYREADRKRKKGDYKSAVTLYKKVLAPSSGVRWWVAPYATYYLGVCYRRTGKIDEAEKQYKKLKLEHPKAKFYPNALVDLGEIQLARGKFVKALDQFIKVADTKVFDTELRYEAGLKTVDAMLGMKAYEPATDDIKKLIKS